ncbi:MAG TPA: NAD(P)-binding protein, partial [Desertimonas sp.]|nr:NAD(P)-binding protein [Desertimonas sp.]
MTRRVVVVGGGIAGLTVAERLADTLGDDAAVVVRERCARVGGKLRTSPFAGRDGVDEGADAFLARVPHGTAL